MFTISSWKDRMEKQRLGYLLISSL